MPSSSDDIYFESDHGLTVTARIVPGDDRRAQVCLAGEIDGAALPALSRMVHWLTTSAPASVLVDLAETTFVCSALPNFIVRLRQVLPDNAELVLWRPGPAARWILRVTDMAAIAVVPEEPTEQVRAAAS